MDNYLSKMTKKIKRDYEVMKEHDVYEPCDKRVDRSTSFVINADDDNFDFLNFIDLGKASYQRVGSKVMNKQLLFRGQITPINNTTAGPFRLRIAIVYDRAPKEGAPEWSEIFKNADYNGALIGGRVDYWPNIDTSNRFVILKDEFWATPDFISAYDSSTAGNQVKGLTNYNQNWFFTWDISLDGLITMYDDNFTGIDLNEYETGRITVHAVTNFENSDLALEYTCRLTWEDLAYSPDLK